MFLNLMFINLCLLTITPKKTSAMKKILILFISLFCFNSFILKAKNTLDYRRLKASLDYHESSNNQLKSAILSEKRKHISNSLFSYSLMQGGFFTVGTSKGNSESVIDDNCQLSFGHPYALSSYAYFIIDDQKIYPTLDYSNESDKVTQNGDTISTSTSYLDQILATTSLYTNINNEVILTYTIKNTDNVGHQIELGLLFDAALGKWGDGHVWQNNGFVGQSNSWQTIPEDYTEIWERESTPKGIGTKLNYDQRPTKTKFGNWNSIFKEEEISEKIYDLAILSTWNKNELLANESASFSIRFELIKPDYDKQMFLRCDLPSAMEIENNQLFPGKLETKVEIINNGESYKALKLHVESSDYIKTWTSENAIEASANETIIYENAIVNIPEIFEDKTIQVVLELKNEDVLLDQFTRSVFIPSSPFSNDGLEVKIDSSFQKFGSSCLRFSCINENTQQNIYNLGKNNIFFYANNIRQEDFKLLKDTTGGVNSADIVFVLDVTGSMGNEIAAVRDNIVEFADSLSYQGIEFQLGMVTFLDNIENTYPFMTDVQKFQSIAAEQFAHGGGDGPENSLEALMYATQFNFRPEANRIVIWITDADYHITDNVTSLSINEVSNALVANGIRVFCIGTKGFQTVFYDPIVMNTGGTYYDINGKFRDVLLEVSRMEQSKNYLLEFPSSISTGGTFKVEVHYAGLGGFDEFNLEKGQPFQNTIMTAQAYPNPVNNQTVIEVVGDEGFRYELELYSNFGHKLASKKIDSFNGKTEFLMQEMINMLTMKHGSLYILRINAIDGKGKILDHKILKLENQ